MLVAHSRTANPSSYSLEDTPLVTPNSPSFPSLGSAVELITSTNANTEPTKSHASLFAPVPKPLPLRPSFGVDLISPTRGRKSDGRLREPSAGGEERARALGTVKKMLQELHVSPIQDHGLISLEPTKIGTWTPMDRYIPPWKLNQSLHESSFNCGDDTSDSTMIARVPKVNLNHATLDEDEQAAMLKDLEKEESNTTVWDSIQEAVRVVEQLQGPNWPSWSFWIQRKIRATNQTIWGHIDGSCPCDSSEEWNADEAAIHCALLSSLDFSVIPEHVRSCTTAKEVWELLEMLYREKPTPESRAVDLIRKLTGMVYYEGDDLQCYLRRFEQIVDELKESPYPVPLELAKQFLLSSLPGTILKHAVSLRIKGHASMYELCQDIMELKKQVLIEYHHPLGVSHELGALLSPDLRYYKYLGDGLLPDGVLYLRAKKTCGACLTYGHKAYAPNCPQTEARLGLWGFQKDAQKPWNRRPGCNGRDPRQVLGAGNGRVSGPTTPGGAPRMRASSAGGISVRSGHASPRSRIPSEGAGSSRSGHGSSAFDLESWR